MSIGDIITLLSGTALFLFGMTLMGDGLKQVAGNRLELILYRLSGTPLRGLLLGTGVTGVIQSSCATSVMVVGFVNSGMMKVNRSFYVILGAILGTSVTGWVICLSYIDGGSGLRSLLSTATLTGIIAIVGIILRMFSKKRMKKNIGGILMGFAVLMFGMSTMSSAVSGLGENESFIALLTTLSNPALGILAGTLFTAALQSASAAVGIIQALSVTGAMGVGEALPLLMGVTIGASVPVLLSAIGAGTDGKRAAAIYPVAGTIGVIVTAIPFYILNMIFRFPFLSASVDPFSVAAVNSFLRLAIVLVLFFAEKPILKLVSLIVKKSDKKKEKERVSLRLEERFIAYPALAVEQCRVAINEMASLARESIVKSVELLGNYSTEGFNAVAQAESDVDAYEDKLGSYLVKLTGREMTKKQREDVSEYLHTLSDFERISDHALNIAESAKELNDKKISFSGEAKRDMGVMTSAVNEIVHGAVRAFETQDLSLAKNTEPLEERIDELCDEIKLRHIARLQRGECGIEQGFVFNDLLTNFERVADHSSNISVAMIELNVDSFETHEYLNVMKEKNTEQFREKYEENAQRFVR